MAISVNRNNTDDVMKSMEEATDRAVSYFTSCKL